jgi:hypothetical protein
MENQENHWPALPLASWEKTKSTIHLYAQIVGKIRLKSMPHYNHWWHVTLCLSSRGLQTGPMPYKGFTFNIEFDFIAHKLELTTSNGFQKYFPLLDGLSVAGFYQKLNDLLHEAGIYVKILAKPYKNKSAIPFIKDNEHNSYDAESVHKFWLILLKTNEILKEFTGGFIGKQCPVHFYWHSFDLVSTRFNGHKAPQMDTTDNVEREAYSHEVISFGFWPGDDNIPDPAFYSYTYPSPKLLNSEPLSPDHAKWVKANGSDMALFMYDDMRQYPDPKQALLAFLDSAYNAGTKTGGWARENLDAKIAQKL